MTDNPFDALPAPDNPFADAFPLVVSRKVYALAVAEGVNPDLLTPVDPPPPLVPPPGPVWCPGRETHKVHRTSDGGHEHACVECGKRVPCPGKPPHPTMRPHKTTDEAVRRKVIPLDQWIPEPPKVCERKGCTNEVPYRGRRICDECRTRP